MRKYTPALLVCAAALLLTLLSARPAAAQINPNWRSFAVYQGGMLVGELYREDTDPGSYTQHWVLYPRYVYPSQTNGIVTELRPGLTEYRDLADFYARVPFAGGSRYVQTYCKDGTTLPGR